MNNILNGVVRCSLYTGTYGRKRCTAKCLGCFVGESETFNSEYQGNTSQVHELMSVLPNLKEAVIMGNPDPSVDTEVCNETAKILQSKCIRVSFLTNGTGDMDIIRKIIDGLDLSLIYGFGFSVDSLDDDKNSILKGKNISLKNTIYNMMLLKDLGIYVVAFFAIWPTNMNDNWQEYTDYFESRGIHVSSSFGSIASAQGRIKHVSEEEILKIRGRYSDVRLATVLANDDEYQEYLSTYVTKNKLQCTSLKKINVYFTGGGLKASYSCPIISAVYPEYLVNIHDIDFHAFHDNTIKTGYCPVAKEAIGFKSAKLHPICRFHKFKPKKLHEYVT